MFELESVSKEFDGVLALDDVELSIPAGRTTVLIGPSGCGKSTLLRTLLGLVRPTSGIVRFRGRPVDADDSGALRRKVGYVIQSGGLFPHLSSRDNVALLARQLGWTRDRIDARIVELTDLARIDPAVWDRYPAQISGGQGQRVALLRALMLDPEVLALDEPLGALDPIVRSELQDELRGVFAALEKTVVLVTHDLDEAAFLADTIVLMRGGRVVQSGSFEDLERRPTDPFVSRFVRAQRRRVSR